MIIVVIVVGAQLTSAKTAARASTASKRRAIYVCPLDVSGGSGGPTRYVKSFEGPFCLLGRKKGNAYSNQLVERERALPDQARRAIKVPDGSYVADHYQSRTHL